MSSMRQDRSHRSGPVGRTRGRRRSNRAGSRSRRISSRSSCRRRMSRQACRSSSRKSLKRSIRSGNDGAMDRSRGGSRSSSWTIARPTTPRQSCSVFKAISRAPAAPAGQQCRPVSGERRGLPLRRGNWVATLDADLQNDPADLAALWDALPGHDAALGWRVKREDVWSKRVISLVRTGCGTGCSGSRSATPAARSGSSGARPPCVCRRFAAATGSSGRCCFGRGVRSCKGR